MSQKKAKVIQFANNFEQSLKEGGSRGDSLKNKTIFEIIENSDIKNKTSILNGFKNAGVGEFTLGSILNENKTEFANKFIDLDVSSSVKKNILGPFKNLFEQIGVTAEGTTNPLRTAVKAEVGDFKYATAGLGTKSNRLIPAFYPIEAYEKIKSVLGLLSTKKSASYNPELKTQLLLHMFGGYRSADFSDLRIENINFKTGIVSGVSLKTDNVNQALAKDVKLTIFPQAQLDIVKSFIAPDGNLKIGKDGKIISGATRDAGLLFQNVDKNRNQINTLLEKNPLEIDYFQESSGKMVKENFSIYDFRRMMESHLTAAQVPIESPARQILTWRAPSGTVQKYTAAGSVAAAVEEINAKAFAPYLILTDGSYNETAGTKTHSQFLNEFDVKTSPFTNRYRVTAESASAIPPALINDAEEKFGSQVFPDGKVISNQAFNIDSNSLNINRELISSRANLEIASNQQRTDELTIKQGDNATAVAEANLKINEANKIVKQQAKDIAFKESAKAGDNLFADIVAENSTISNSPSISDNTTKVAVSVNEINPKTNKKFTKKEVAALSAAGIFTVSSSAEAANLAGTVVRDELMELGLGAGLAKVAPQIAKTLAGRALPLAGVLAATESSETNMPEVQSMARQNVEQKYFTDPSMTERPIYKDDRRLSDTDMFDKNALPSSSMGLKGRRLETKRRDTGKSLIPNYNKTQLSTMLSGGKPDMQAGFVTKPNRSELGDETERQLKSNSFLGAT